MLYATGELTVYFDIIRSINLVIEAIFECEESPYFKLGQHI